MDKYLRKESIHEIKGIGDKTAKLYAKLNIKTKEDLLSHYPTRYLTFEEPRNIRFYKERADKDKKICIYAELLSGIKTVYAGKYKISSGILYDGQEKLDVKWYNSPYIASSLKAYKRYVFVGQISYKKNQPFLEHPIAYTKEEYDKLLGSLAPVYPLTKGISSNHLKKTIQSLLQTLILEEYGEFLPKQIIREHMLIDRKEAIQKIHFPNSFDEALQAKKRLAFEEFFLFLYNMGLEKISKVNLKSDFIISGEVQELLDILPFTLTDSQNKAFAEIAGDLASGKIMNRLLQGDVGSGKTIIAVLAMYMAYKHGYQSAIMVPTEVLANQHFANIEALFAKLKNPPNIILLSGSMKAKQKKEAYALIESGEADIIIGTHALIQEKVNYHNLALIVTDEQHRFGVRQRQVLAEKGNMPHILVMSATPIPRTLAVILYGDLDISIIDTKPQGRLPIKNAVIGKNDRGKAYRSILNELDKGYQAYVICSMIEESENIEAENVMDYYEKIRPCIDEKYTIGILHGKMEQKKKDEIMQDFQSGKIHILISTTVIEVGVDVKNATIMLIEDAQRFGLASLHQLRGRVGRNSVQSYCIFVRTSDSETAKKRLEVIGNSNDGFYIASEDLKLRGPGELFGMAQSGELDFGIADIYNDSDMLKLASDSVKKIFKGEMILSQEDRKKLEEAVEEYRKDYYNLTL